MTIANGDKVKNLVETNKVAKAAFEALRGLNKHRPSNDINRLRLRIKEEGSNISLQELIAVFKQLQNMGLGKVVISSGVNNVPSFHWNYKVKDVLQAVFESGGNDVSFSHDKQSLLPGGSAGKQQRLTTVPIPVRPGMVVRVDVPAGCTKKDIEYAMSTLLTLDDLFG